MKRAGEIRWYENRARAAGGARSGRCGKLTSKYETKGVSLGTGASRGVSAEICDVRRRRGSNPPASSDLCIVALAGPSGRAGPFPTGIRPSSTPTGAGMARSCRISKGRVDWTGFVVGLRRVHPRGCPSRGMAGADLTAICPRGIVCPWCRGQPTESRSACPPAPCAARRLGHATSKEDVDLSIDHIGAETKSAREWAIASGPLSRAECDPQLLRARHHDRSLLPRLGSDVGDARARLCRHAAPRCSGCRFARAAVCAAARLRPWVLLSYAPDERLGRAADRRR